MAVKMTKKNADAVAEFEKNIFPLLNYQKIDDAFTYLKNTAFTPKQIETISELIENKFYPISSIYNKPNFDSVQPFADSIPYFLSVRYAKDLPETENKEEYLEVFTQKLLNVTKNNFLSYLSYSLTSNIDQEFTKDFHKEIIQEINKLDTEIIAAIKLNMQHLLGSLDSISAPNIPQIKSMLDNNLLEINSFYNDKNLSFLAKDIETLQFLKDNGADFSLSNTRKETCTFYNKNIECLEFLNSEGVNLNHLNIHDKNVAFYIIKNHSVKIDSIIKLGVNIHQFDTNNSNLLNYTTSVQQAKDLLKNNLTIKNNNFYNEQIRNLIKADQEKKVLQNEINNTKKINLSF